jgi:NAD-dependent dihydropyrimidine dehydrogenase PreA subunit
VDIYLATDEGVRIVGENLDECVLCGLCLDASPPDAVKVFKLYDGEALLERAAA